MFKNLNAEQGRYGFTNEAMAEKLGISRQVYEYKKEHGTFNVSESQKLCEIFGVSFEYLFAA